MEKKDPIEEARRHVANVEEVIKKANYDPELKNLYRRQVCEDSWEYAVERLPDCT